MPREIYLVAREPVTFEALVEAATVIDGSLVPRFFSDGAVLQLVDRGDVAVLSVESSRLISAPTDLERITGPLPTTEAVWWTEATAPWGPAGAVGVGVARALSRLLDARLQVEEGQPRDAS